MSKDCNDWTEWGQYILKYNKALEAAQKSICIRMKKTMEKESNLPHFFQNNLEKRERRFSYPSLPGATPPILPISPQRRLKILRLHPRFGYSNLKSVYLPGTSAPGLYVPGRCILSR